MNEYFTVLNVSEGKYEEKRSVFIAEIFPCDTPEKAAEIVASQKNKYWDSKHVVHAYCLLDGSVKAADDGEPHGTSGKPVLDVICGAGLKNVLVTVVRYFGGVLLGTGGLVKAYSTAAKEAVQNADIIKMCLGAQYTCCVDYQQYQTIQRILFSYDCIINNSEFSDNVLLDFTVSADLSNNLQMEITDTFAGKVTLNLKNNIFYVKK